MPSPAPSSWLDYWNEDTPYVSERHRILHARRLARDVSVYIPSPDAHLLDWGCGEALGAEQIAARCGRLTLSDGAPALLERVRRRVAGHPTIVVLAPDEVGPEVADASLDLTIVMGVVQYLPRDGLMDLLDLVHRKSRAQGRLLIGDVVPPDLSGLKDAAALLHFGLQGGFLRAAAVGLVRAAVSRDHALVREEAGFATYEEGEMLALLESAGFEPARAPDNLGHNPHRMTFVASRTE